MPNLRPIPTHVLLVEDDPDAARLVHLWLDDKPGCADNTGHDWIVQDAYTVEDACDLLGSWDFDCILLDLGMPGYNSKAVFDTIKDCAGETPIIVMSANATDEMHDYVMHHGAVEFLPKLSVQGQGVKAAICEAMEWSEIEQQIDYLKSSAQAHDEVSRRYQSEGFSPEGQ